MTTVISLEPRRGKRDRKSTDVVPAPPTFAPSAISPPPAVPQPPKPFVKLQTGATFNTIGTPLPESWQPYAPRGESLTPVRLSIHGSQLDPPSARVYEDSVLWNAREGSVAPEAFAGGGRK